MLFKKVANSSGEQLAPTRAATGLKWAPLSMLTAATSGDNQRPERSTIGDNCSAELQAK